MNRVRVYRSPGDGVDEAELEALLAAADCEVVEDEGGEEAGQEAEDASDEDEPDAECPPLVVVLTPELCEDEALEPELIRTVRSGAPIVGIWPEGSDGRLPKSAEKYIGVRTVWAPERVRDALSGDAPRCDTPTGEPRPAQNTRRNPC